MAAAPQQTAQPPCGAGFLDLLRRQALPGGNIEWSRPRNKPRLLLLGHLGMSNERTIDLGLILLGASVVAMISRRMRLPCSVGRVAAGIMIAPLPMGVGIPITPDSIYTILLPAFRRDLPVVLTLAFVRVGIAAVVVAAGMHVGDSAWWPPWARVAVAIWAV